MGVGHRALGSQSGGGGRRSGAWGTTGSPWGPQRQWPLECVRRTLGAQPTPAESETQTCALTALPGMAGSAQEVRAKPEGGVLTPGDQPGGTSPLGGGARLSHAPGSPAPEPREGPSGVSPGTATGLWGVKLRILRWPRRRLTQGPPQRAAGSEVRGGQCAGREEEPRPVSRHEAREEGRRRLLPGASARDPSCPTLTSAPNRAGPRASSHLSQFL